MVKSSIRFPLPFLLPSPNTIPIPIPIPISIHIHIHIQMVISVHITFQSSFLPNFLHIPFPLLFPLPLTSTPLPSLPPILAHPSLPLQSLSIPLHIKGVKALSPPPSSSPFHSLAFRIPFPISSSCSLPVRCLLSTSLPYTFIQKKM